VVVQIIGRTIVAVFAPTVLWNINLLSFGKLNLPYVSMRFYHYPNKLEGTSVSNDE
jgi:hypothetical protein